MNGEVGLRSRPGAGSTFWFEVPLDKLSAGSAEPAGGELSPAKETVRVAAAQPRGKAGGKSRILLAEDNPTSQRLVQIIAESRGYEIIVVDNGAAALRALSAEDFDLVLMDCQMPEMNGLQATRAIRQGGSKVPIVALTARAQKDDSEQCRAAGMDDYLSKPFRQKQLVDMLEKWLAASSAATS